MKKPADGEQDLKFYLMDIKSVFTDLLADSRLQNHQFFQFQEYKDERNVRLVGEANGSLAFQSAAAKIGPGKVPLSIVVYIDGTYIKNGIDVRPIYGEYLACQCILYFQLCSSYTKTLLSQSQQEILIALL